MKVRVTITEKVTKEVEVDFNDYINSSEELTDNERTFRYVEILNEIKQSPQSFIDENENQFNIDTCVERVSIDALK